jgi:hypothetical protein
MRQISLKHSLLFFLEELEYTEAALSADDDARSLAPAYQARIEDWKGIFDKERTSRRNVIRGNAVVAVRNEQLDASTIRLAATARGAAVGFLDKVLSVSPSRFVKKPLREQCETTRDVLLVELAKLDPGNPVRALAPALESLNNAALTALDERTKAKNAQTTVGNDIDEWKNAVNAQRLTTFADLLKIAALKGYPRAWAESFYRTVEKNDKPETDDTEPADAKNGTPAAPAAPVPPTPATPPAAP